MPFGGLHIKVIMCAHGAETCIHDPFEYMVTYEMASINLTVDAGARWLIEMVGTFKIFPTFSCSWLYWESDYAFDQTHRPWPGENPQATYLRYEEFLRSS